MTSLPFKSKSFLQDGGENQHHTTTDEDALISAETLKKATKEVEKNRILHHSPNNFSKQCGERTTCFPSSQTWNSSCGPKD
jgi:hypothetical protein